MKNSQQGADDKPQTETKVKFYKEDKNTLNCALLFNIVFTLCILLYRIVFVLVWHKIQGYDVLPIPFFIYFEWTEYLEAISYASNFWRPIIM